jgi:2-succinyl-6-hydroxy-2,4-cyclohexadiene-1-carboxylate synthase
MQTLSIYALHGFLGKTTDWEKLFCHLPDSVAIHTIDIFRDFPIAEFWQWADYFHEKIEKEKVQDSSPRKRVLVGYSLGGRLVLHALLRKPELWDAAVVISAHPGLKSSEEKEQRRKTDEQWARRFEEESWNTLMHDWNDRDVFKSDRFHFQRSEKDFSRQMLAKALREWSLGNQKYLFPEIRELPMPICWMVGALDKAYASSVSAESIAGCHPQSCVRVIPQAGHRAPWEKSEVFRDYLSIFLNQINREIIHDVYINKNNILVRN